MKFFSSELFFSPDVFAYLPRCVHFALTNNFVQPCNEFTIYFLNFQKKFKKQKAEKAAGKPAKDAGKSASAVKELSPPPEFIAERLALWDRLKKEQDEQLAAKASEPIVITLPDGKEVNGESWRTTPYDVAAGISKGLADNSVVGE